MNAEHHDLERVGLRVAAEQDRLLAKNPLPAADLILEGIASRRRKHRARRQLLGVGATALVMMLAVLGVLRARPLAREASRAPVIAPPALGVTRAEASPVPLQFADGTRVVVKRGASADLRELREHGATIALESGSLDVEVVHAEGSRWDIVAGQFDVRVTGTRFDATWDPQAKVLTVAMVTGTVRVSGPCVDESLSAPNTKVFACNDASSSPAGSVVSGDVPAIAAAPPRPPVSATEPNAAALLGLADDARLAGDAPRARKLYARVRERFPHTGDAAKAAFLLGRMAEAAGAADDAVRFYELARGERPSGPFAQDALGRTMELEQRRGNGERARALAAEYLQEHPNGPYKAYAASVLDARR